MAPRTRSTSGSRTLGFSPSRGRCASLTDTAQQRASRRAQTPSNNLDFMQTFDRLLGQGVSVRLALSNRGQRYFSGIVRRFGQGGPVPAADGKTAFYRYRAEVVPQLWLLTRKVQSRVFQQISVPDILKQVLHQ